MIAIEISSVGATRVVPWGDGDTTLIRREGFGTIFGDENNRACEYMRIRIIYPKRFIREDV